MLSETRIVGNLVTEVVVGVGLNWANSVPPTGIALKHTNPPAAVGDLETLAAVALYGVVQGHLFWQSQGTAALQRSYETMMTHLGQATKLGTQPVRVLGISPAGNLRVQTIEQSDPPRGKDPGGAARCSNFGLQCVASNMADYRANGMIHRSGLVSCDDMPPSLTWLRLLTLCGGITLVSGGAAFAETSEASSPDAGVYTSADLLRPLGQPMPTVEPSAQPVYEPPAAPAPSAVFSGPRTSPSVSLTSTESGQVHMQVPPPAPPPTSIVAQAPAASGDMWEAIQPSEPMPDAVARPAAPAPTLNPSQVVPSELAADETVPPGYNSVFIDPTDYSLGATPAPQTPSITFAERSTGCEITINSGGAVPGNACGTPTTAAAPSGESGDGIQVGPVTVSSRGVTLGSTTILSREFLNERIRPLNVLRRGNEEYIFPLSVPATITSLFGWRVHPVYNSWRFHSGTDLAAPLGTPVLATRSGRVTVSDFLGGYGLTVIMRHEGDELESRYAHLSQVAVEPGEWVEQGEVIGLVGSTGTSTGPHLHFEMRQLTAQGWVAVDAREVLDYGIANLLEIIDNPLLALGKETADDVEAELNRDLPFRPAQPNAS